MMGTGSFNSGYSYKLRFQVLTVLGELQLALAASFFTDFILVISSSVGPSFTLSYFVIVADTNGEGFGYSNSS